MSWWRICLTCYCLSARSTVLVNHGPSPRVACPLQHLNDIWSYGNLGTLCVRGHCNPRMLMIPTQGSRGESREFLACQVAMGRFHTQYGTAMLQLWSARTRQMAPHLPLKRPRSGSNDVRIGVSSFNARLAHCKTPLAQQTSLHRDSSVPYLLATCSSTGQAWALRSKEGAEGCTIINKTSKYVPSPTS